jgi:Fe-S-cluster-containing dehydrogenase component
MYSFEPFPDPDSQEAAMQQLRFASRAQEDEALTKLPPRPGDVELTAEELSRLLGIFRSIKANLGLKTNPDALRLRHYFPGEIICSRGEPGNSAYYVLPAADLAAVHAHLSARPRPDQLQETLQALERVRGQSERRLRWAGEARQLAERLEALEKQLAQAGDYPRASLYARCRLAGMVTKLVKAELLREQEPELAELLSRLAELEDACRVAVARVAAAPLAVRRQTSFWQRLWGGWKKPPPTPLTIPNDGPGEIDYDSGEASLFEDEVFGEMACLDRQPRTATVQVVHECFVLEILRPVLDNMRKDPAYRKKLDDKYRERVLELHLRALPLFEDLEPSLIARIRREADLEPYEAGTLICDQHERSEALYLIRSGTVKVMQNVSALLSLSDVRSPEAIGRLAPGQPGPYPAARQAVWERLPADVAALAAQPRGCPPGQLQQVVDALNDLLCDPLLVRQPELARVADGENLHLQTWRHLTAADAAGAAHLAGWNRRLLAAALLGKPAVWREVPIGPDRKPVLPGPLETADVGDWKALCQDLEPSARKPDHPATPAAQWLWQQLSAEVQDLVRQGKATGRLDSGQQERLAQELNRVAEHTFPLLEPEFQGLVAEDVVLQGLIMALRDGGQKWTEHDWRRFSRLRNRLLLHALYPEVFGAEYVPPGPPLVLSYCTRGDFLGEMGLLLGQPRSATCVAYNHPANDPAREVGPVQIVRISKELFWDLAEKSPAFRSRVMVRVRERQAATRRQREATQSARQRRTSWDASAEQLGLAQGQRLMLIDLDRCTRCDECVRACVATHDDGLSRLLLDGPRVQQPVQGQVRTLLAPTTCRACVDPVCMIPCPVGSIVRGEQGQILIRDWCIGCEKCAKNCPYGAIQMQPIGLVPARSPAWRFLPAWKLRSDAGGRDWTALEYRDRSWPTIRTPVLCDADFVARLGRLPDDPAVCFRHRFSFAGDSRSPAGKATFRLVLTPLLPGTQVWLNGQPIPDLEARKGEGLREIEPAEDATPASGPETRAGGTAGPAGEPATARKPSRALRILRPGKNVVAVRVPLPRQLGGPLFELKIVAFEGTVVELKAVVCDLCNQPAEALTACVRACPHEAALRFDARAGIPVW